MRLPDPTDPTLDRAMSVRLVSISGRASAEQSGFRGGRAWRTIAHFACVLGSLGDDGGQFAADAGREMDERGEPAGEDGHERERQRAAKLAGVQPRLAANQAPARSATPTTNETAARTR